MTNLRNYDNKGVDRNSSLMMGDYGGGIYFQKMHGGGIFDASAKHVICLVIIDKYITCVCFC